ncbi:uncharacterized protein LOC129875922 isoform X1 [Solanum dulcamara]|uniref:uncharacterized protein LOC129875922 isoform X1 n=1 Tax=Solanum dulcamara TaxID=45834 RepID=UPI00248513D9|nr:uncharacterized protein LOC129875922 isoform X1 [Solanum dulcamara]
MRGRMDPRIDKLVRGTTMVATVTASYFLLTADYGPEPSVLDPICSDLFPVNFQICSDPAPSSGFRRDLPSELSGEPSESLSHPLRPRLKMQYCQQNILSKS